MHHLLWLVILLPIAFVVEAKPVAPVLFVNSEGLQANLHWSKVDNATGYRLFYAPYPFKGVETIASFDVSTNTGFSVELWQQAAYYVAIKAYDSELQSSDFSNIGFLKIQDRGIGYRTFWQSVIQEINQKQFTSDDFLYQQLPSIDNCIAGVLNDPAKKRQVETLNQIRQLHGLDVVIIDDSENATLQNAALIQKANGFLTHNPAESAQCFSQSGLQGSSSSNLTLAENNIDPADDLIGLVDDAFNIADVGAVGHRRHLLNPFLQFTSYGQVFGASAIKVFDFSSKTTTPATQIPNIIAFPNSRYPYVFFSDKDSTKQTPWNLTIIENKQSITANQHPYFTDSKVSVIQKDSGQNLVISHLFTDTKNIGIPNNLSWIVENWQYDTWYTVSIDNIQYQSGNTENLEYDVFIDYKNFFEVNFPIETDDRLFNTNQVKGTLTNIDDKDSFTVPLAGRVTFSGNSQFSNQAFFIAVYNRDKILLKANDSTFSLSLPDNLYTLVLTNCHLQQCYNGFKEYTVTFN